LRENFTSDTGGASGGSAFNSSTDFRWCAVLKNSAKPRFVTSTSLDTPSRILATRALSPSSLKRATTSSDETSFPSTPRSDLDETMALA
jgi:hypothetical protein